MVPAPDRATGPRPSSFCSVVGSNEPAHRRGGNRAKRVGEWRTTIPRGLPAALRASVRALEAQTCALMLQGGVSWDDVAGGR